ncbi:helix-turn-helix domain-containing protein [Actinoalloteichus sp. AHMU CJ021]
MAEVARLIGCSTATMSLTETGKRLPPVEDVAAILAVLSVTGAKRERLVRMAREAAVEPRWLGVGIPGLAPQVTGMAELERTSVRITAVAPNLVPGLLQTANYARAVFAGSDVNPSEIEARTTFRMGRQRALDEVTYVALVDESVLRRPVGGARVIRDQLEHLVEMAGRPNITIQVLPMSLGWHDALEGPFVILEGEKTAPVVHLEHKRSGLFLDEDDADEVQTYMRSAANLQQRALTARQSVELIAAVHDDWSTNAGAAATEVANV